MTNIALFDILLRGAAIALMLVTGGVMFKNNGMTRKSTAFLGAGIIFSAYLVVSSPHLSDLPKSLLYFLMAVAAFGPVLVYGLVVEMFVDRFLFRWWHGGAAAVIVLSAWGHSLWPLAGAVRGTVAILLYMHLFYLVIAGSKGDLIEERRRFRWWFLICVTLFALTIGLIELFISDDDIVPILFPIHALVFVALSTVFLLWAMDLKDGIWIIESKTSKPEQATLTSSDKAILSRLQAEMQQGIWQREGLSIRDLAGQIKTPEHRLRGLINKGLGYRNFPQYINEQRIRAAKAILDDPAQADTAILSIAYDVGFSSLGPFNRAFRDITGLSPTEYRRNS